MRANSNVLAERLLRSFAAPQAEFDVPIAFHFSGDRSKIMIYGNPHTICRVLSFGKNREVVLVANFCDQDLGHLQPTNHT